MNATLRKGLIILGIAALLGVAGDMFLRFAGPQRLRFTYLTGILGQPEYDAMATQPGWAPASVTVAAGVELRGLVRRPRTAGAPWVLFYPGNDAAQLRSGQTFLSRLAEDEDWGLAVFAYRGYDGSGGWPHLADLAHDAPIISSQLREKEGIDPERLHFVGFSIGGHIAVHAALSAARDGKPATSLTLMNPVDDIVMLRRSRWQRLAPGDDFQTRPLLAGVPAPVLVLQGGADEALNGNTQGLAIARALSGRARYEELAGVGHQQLLDVDATFVRVREFITAHAKARAAP
jgi:pimeloyl-ACP methyl ester carboxylesterase